MLLSMLEDDEVKEESTFECWLKIRCFRGHHVKKGRAASRKSESKRGHK